MNKSASITFEDGCNKYLDYCRHSSLAITQNYINLLVSAVKKQVNEVNLLNKFSSKQRRFISMPLLVILGAIAVFYLKTTFDFLRPSNPPPSDFNLMTKQTLEKQTKNIEKIIKKNGGKIK